MLTIKVEASPGAEIKETFEKAIELAEKLNCYIDFDFNGVLCSASPGGSAERGASRYHEVIKDTKNTYKLATA